MRRPDDPPGAVTAIDPLPPFLPKFPVVESIVTALAVAHAHFGSAAGGNGTVNLTRRVGPLDLEAG